MTLVGTKEFVFFDVPGAPNGLIFLEFSVVLKMFDFDFDLFRSRQKLLVVRDCHIVCILLDMPLYRLIQSGLNMHDAEIKFRL